MQTLLPCVSLLTILTMIKSINSSNNSPNFCTRGQRAQPELVRRLLGNPLTNLTVDSVTKCQDICHLEHDCQGWNYHVIDKICEMMNSNPYQKKATLVKAPQWIFMVNPSHPCVTYQNPCGENGNCSRAPSGSPSSFQCSCVSGFTGQNCSQDVDECLTNPCLNNGTCVNYHGGFRCSCQHFRVGKLCETVLATSCKSYYDFNSNYRNGEYELSTSSAPVYCHMEEIKECGGGGWTLALKMNGNLETFHYTSDLWTNKETFQPEAGSTGLDDMESKLSTFWTLPFTAICLGMRSGGDLKWLGLSYSGNSLFDIFSDGLYRELSLTGWDEWKTLAAGSSLQVNCKKSGFNLGIDPHASCRVGIVGNNEDHCLSNDSRFGFGCYGGGCGYRDINTCGNVGRCGAVLGDADIKAFGYILIK